MKVLQVSTEDNTGGASRSAYRLHQALIQEDVDCSMRVLTHDTANSRVKYGRAPRSYAQKIKDKLEQQRWGYFSRKWHTDNPILHSFGRMSSGICAELNQSSADVLNLHWISKLLSIEDIGRLQKPLVWTLHDMWPFCGGEHYAPEDEAARFRHGYLLDNRPASERGPDLNRFAWEAKRIAWKSQRFAFVCPSAWMAECLGQSALFRDAPVTTYVVPNPIDTEDLWRPIDKAFARKQLGLDPNQHYVLAGSAGGMSKNKGEDLLPELTQRLRTTFGEKIELIIFGRYAALANEQWHCKVHWMGSVRDDAVMATIYSAADVMIVPSRQDNLPNTAVEAMACATPVAAFNLGGLPDIVDHESTGWLANPEDLADLSRGIEWMLKDKNRLGAMSALARASAARKFSPKEVVKQYVEVYTEAIARYR
jgi:glycosyltransferase involved in cell wall biosynthesis